MGSQTDRFRYEVFQNLILRPMNTGLLRPAVATVPTVYGIETDHQHTAIGVIIHAVATVPTVYGIETFDIYVRVCIVIQLQQYLPFTVLKLNKLSIAFSF